LNTQGHYFFLWTPDLVLVYRNCVLIALSCVEKRQINYHLRFNSNESQLPRSPKINGTAQPKTAAEKGRFQSGRAKKCEKENKGP